MGTDSILPSKLYGALDTESVCWSAVMPDDRFIMPHNLYKLQIIAQGGFFYYRTPLWNQDLAVRRDVRGGYIAYAPKKYIILNFFINGTLGSLSNVYVAISHEANGGETAFTIRDSTGISHETIINCSRQNVMAMDIQPLGKYTGGSADLSVETINGGCHVSAIIVEQTSSISLEGQALTSTMQNVLPWPNAGR